MNTAAIAKIENLIRNLQKDPTALLHSRPQQQQQQQHAQGSGAVSEEIRQKLIAQKRMPMGVQGQHMMGGIRPGMGKYIPRNAGGM